MSPWPAWKYADDFPQVMTRHQMLCVPHNTVLFVGIQCRLSGDNTYFTASKSKTLPEMF